MGAYRERLGSDVPGDGMYLELDDDNGQVVVFVWRSDVTGEFAVHLGEAPAPSDVIEAFIARAKMVLAENAV